MKKLLIILAILVVGQSYSQDIRGAYIRTKKVSGYTYSITVTLFTDASMSVNRPTIPIGFGDAATASFSLNSTSNSGGFIIKTYSGTHTYANAGLFISYYVDTYRIPNIKNMSNSQTQQVSASAYIAVNNFIAVNTSPDFL